ncbi:hypothetical protein [uncultured Legionella sp.]|uniref:hypothetical protein n=1 Tax=uncultured Legionella sp. TaxID=210934 RepID=UPI002632E6A6|nr:hypothetical protein [uncultured Legionella sp.]
MFFKPYKSKEEFMFCVRNTLQPAAILAVMSSLVFSAPIGGALMCGVAIAGCVLLGGVEDPSLSINLTEEIATRTLQAAINLILFPVTLITLITRSISTIASFTMGEDEPSMPEEPKIIPELRLIP